jgi:SAM-dependent methyltransferase
MLPNDNQLSVLDIGCGTGEICQQLQELRPNIQFVGAEVNIRPNALIETVKFDGNRLPFSDQSFDFALLVDVLHHTQNPSVLLMEARRVARQFVLLKDHICASKFDYLCLRFMDWVGNRSYDIELPYNYLSSTQWYELCNEIGLAEESRLDSLKLYPLPFSLVFDRKLHFVGKLVPK